MAKVKNLAIQLQTGSTSTLYASWEFDGTVKETQTSTNTNGIKQGDLVSIKSGATYYNGVAIPDWVMSDQWYIMQVTGDRAVLGKNKSGSNNIVSPINTAYLSNGSSGSGTTTTVTSSVAKDTLDHYEIKWTYDTGDNIWFEASSATTENDYAIASSFPENANRVRITVTPVAKTYKSNDEDVPYWTGTAVSAEYSTSYNPPEEPSTPSVTIDKYKLTATIENVSDPRTDQIEFEIINGTDTNAVNRSVQKVVTCQASAQFNISAGGQYRVRCRAINLNGSKKIYSDWSDYTSTMTTIPAAPNGITELRATDETSVYIAWDAVSSATSYDIEYSTETRYFDGSDSTTTQSGIESNHYEFVGLESGDEYFFRVRAVNSEGASTWTDIKSVVIGSDPSAPTTWSSTTKAIVGESLTLYWVHNSADGSSQTYAELEMYVDDVKEVHVIQNSTDEDEKDKTSSYSVNTNTYTEGTTIQWRVRTAGITNNFGDWSTMRTVEVYAQPTLEIAMVTSAGTAISTLTSFPFYISGLAAPATQLPLSYSLSIIANDTYETVDNIGNPKTIIAGDTVYSGYFDITDALLIELTAHHVDLQDGVEYTVLCTVAMDSGLTAEASLTFDVSWDEISYEPDAGVVIDDDSYVAFITPYCRDTEGETVSGVNLSVYRRDFDGGFTEIATGIPSDSNTVVTDPHPALDYARYRIIAITESTGAVGYYDLPAIPVGCTSVIIQWDERWSNFVGGNEDPLVNPPWGGSLLELPYNIKISDSHDPEVTHVEYVGRAHPVAYHGTQVGHTATWNMEVPKSDKETLYALRRLGRYLGNVYVRELTGSGYWATIKVSYNQDYSSVKLPITLTVTRVEGGV